METVEVVIKIPKKVLERIQSVANGSWGRKNLDALELAILDGISLPKGHGRLIDENTIAYTDEEFADGHTYMIVHQCDIEDAPTVIEADKGGMCE